MPAAGKPGAGIFRVWVAVLSVGGMMPNLAIMVADRGLSKRMALPHLVFWTPLVFLLIWILAGLLGAGRGGRKVLEHAGVAAVG